MKLLNQMKLNPKLVFSVVFFSGALAGISAQSTPSDLAASGFFEAAPFSDLVPIPPDALTLSSLMLPAAQSLGSSGSSPVSGGSGIPPTPYVPEHSLLTLAGVGAAAMFLGRRRK